MRCDRSHVAARIEHSHDLDPGLDGAMEDEMPPRSGAIPPLSL
jgi:hypothetical protein